MSNSYKQLSEFEKSVLLHKATERPYTGEYTDFFEHGVYTCKQCGSHLYESQSKFHSSCGWPSFDNEIPGAVERVPDEDGKRTEIICSTCKGHLGHVFLNEGFTPKNVRHCVNSISMSFVAQKPTIETAYFASGCFWGTEYWMSKAKGVIKTTVGYTGGDTTNPTYEDVCSGRTGHAEAVEVVFNTAETDFESLCKVFFNTHDPSQLNRQGPDIGEQYRSALFYTNALQRQIADDLYVQLFKKGINVATEISAFTTFYPAEDYHQNYYEKNHKLPYCHSYKEIL